MTTDHIKFLPRYILVGIVNTVIYSCLLWFFLSVNKFQHPVSVGLAFIMAMCFQYFANKHFTFGVESSSLRGVYRYLVAALVNYIFSVFVVWVGLDIISLSTFSASLLSAFFASVIGYFLSLFWVYRR